MFRLAFPYLNIATFHLVHIFPVTSPDFYQLRLSSSDLEVCRMNVNISVKFSNFCRHIFLSTKNLSYLCYSLLYFTIIVIWSFTLYSAVRLRADTWLSLAFSLLLFNAYSFQKHIHTTSGILFRTLAIVWIVSKHVCRTGSLPVFRQRNEIFIIS
jgi:hypothetical protein